MSDAPPAPTEHGNAFPTYLDVSKHLQGGIVSEPMVYSPPRDEFRIPPASPLEICWRHSGWSHNREKVWAALKAIGSSDARLDRFAQCGSMAYVLAEAKTGELRISANYCHDRLCVPCAIARSAAVTQALLEAAKGKTVRFATLTMRHSDTPLKAQIDRLNQSFRRLRQTAWWKHRCTGGAAVMELKIGRDGLWHVHLHCLLLGAYIDQTELSENWHSITGDSHVVDIRMVKDEDAIRYVASYSGKCLDGSIYRSAERLCEFALAVKGRRIINTWGEWSSVSLASVDPALGREWFVVGSLGKLLEDAQQGDQAAQLIVVQLYTRSRRLRAMEDG